MEKSVVQLINKFRNKNEKNDSQSNYDTYDIKLKLQKTIQVYKKHRKHLVIEQVMNRCHKMVLLQSKKLLTKI